MVSGKTISSTVKALTCLLFLALAITCAASARILDEEILPTVPVMPEASDPVAEPSPEATVVPEASDPVVAPEITQSNVSPVGGVAPVDIPSITQANANPTPTISANIANTHLPPIADTDLVPTPSTDVTPTTIVAPGASVTAAITPKPNVSPVVGVAPVGVPATQPNANPTSATSANVANADPHHTLSFFMHDVLGGSTPSAKAVTGIVTNPAVLSVNNGNSGVINNNNLPLPGRMTVIDDELTQEHELGSGLVGKAQGFYVVSSEDGSGQCVALTAVFESGSYADSINFFGVLRTAVSESQLGIMGGTGKYVNAEGYATVKTIHSGNQHNTDGLETLLEFTVYLA